jgi:UDP-4-amino-4-deoxy-L-arabinose formyltransferase/UDP-glucuronic acid dehydrogenase (UDP-4-keto-hexauronic acid decarboxylating)
MEGGIDTGPIAYEARLTIQDDDTGLTLSAKCVRAGIPLLHALLHDAATGTVPHRPQPSRIRRYYGREVPQEGRLLWTESATQVVNFIRACDYLPFTSPWGYPRGYLAGREVSVLKAMHTGEQSEAPAGTVGQRVGGDVWVAAADEWVRVRRVQVGSITCAASEVLRPGDRFAVPTDMEAPSHAIR